MVIPEEFDYTIKRQKEYLFEGKGTFLCRLGLHKKDTEYKTVDKTNHTLTSERTEYCKRCGKILEVTAFTTVGSLSIEMEDGKITNCKVKPLKDNLK